MIAGKLPPPAELDDLGGGAEPGEGSAGEEADDAAAESSAMEDFASSLKHGKVEDQVAAFKSLMDICSPKGP
jgi:hypothetical protein